MSKGSSVYETVTHAIIEELEQGVAPWVKPWSTANPVELPYNAATSRPYSGVNILLLWFASMAKGYRRPAWLTFRQAQELGGHIKKGEKAEHIVYAATYTKPGTHPDTGEATEEQIPFLRWYTVFNVEQTEGLPAHLYQVAEPKPFDQAMAEAEGFLGAIGADVRHGYTMACYYGEQDFIALPNPQDFESAGHYYATSFHEHVHYAGSTIMPSNPINPSCGAARSV